jgi:hypothetical protein
MSHPEAARVSFELITQLASDGHDQFVTLDNFGGLVTVLDDFATSASLSVEMQQAHGRRSKPLDMSKYVIQFWRNFPTADITSAHLQSNEASNLLNYFRISKNLSRPSWRP